MARVLDLMDDYIVPMERRVYAAAAMEQSAAMADRFHRLFLRTLRALRDLRRYGRRWWSRARRRSTWPSGR